MSRLINARDFKALYGINEMVVYNALHNSLDWAVTVHGKPMVKIDCLLERQAYLERLWLIAHDYFFYFNYAIGLSETNLALAISKKTRRTESSWIMFFHKTLFARRDESITKTHSNEMQEEFIVYSEKVIPGMHQKYKHDPDYRERLKDIDAS